MGKKSVPDANHGNLSLRRLWDETGWDGMGWDGMGWDGTDRSKGLGRVTWDRTMVAGMVR